MKIVDGFTIVKQLGCGSTSTVFLAVDKVGNNRTLKIYDNSERNEFLINRFEQEATNLAKLRSDKIVTIIGKTKSSQNEDVIVQEYIDGVTLRYVLKNTITLHERIRLAIKVGLDLLEALDYAHQQSIIHRDIKPENILIENITNRVVLSDFGLSKDINDQTHTVMQGINGSPQYMCPEQFANITPTPFFDIYAVFVIIYEIVTSKTPFDVNTFEELLDVKRKGQYKCMYINNFLVPYELSLLVDTVLQYKSKNSLSAMECKAKLEIIDQKYCSLNSNEADLNTKVTTKLLSVHKKIRLDRLANSRVVDQLEMLTEKDLSSTKNKFLVYIIISIILIISLFVFFRIHDNDQQKITDIKSQSPEKITESAIVVPISTIAVPTKPQIIKVEPTVIPILPAKTADTYGFVVLNVPSDVTVIIDDVVKQERGKQILLNVGFHQVSLIKKDKKPIITKIEILPEKVSTIDLE